jgi:murein DD-endopeptidase MepM/ murein hydrolase activator NlpD
MKNFKFVVLRWSIFLSFVFVVFFSISIYAQKAAKTITVSVPEVSMPSFSAQHLLNDVFARLQYLKTKTKEVDFSIYTVKPKDNLWKIAKKYGYSVHTLIGTNPQLTTYDINTNQKILVPSVGGTLHPIQENDTWQIISKKYDISEETLKKTNYGVIDLIEEKYVFIPGKKPAIDLLNEDMQEKYALRSLFVSPVGGRLTSVFGKRRHPVTGKTSTHGGIDIAVPRGTWVGAAAAGVVIAASYNIGHYGTAVFIDHKNGYITHYGHLSSISVRVGQKVRAGQFIGKSGATGRVTGPHLHFTIKKGDKSLDPLKFLW